MCGRFAGSEPAEVLARRFHARSTIVWRGSDDCRPTQQLPVVVADGQQRWLRLASWGLHFDWSKRPIINARAETAASKRSFAPLWRQQRCLVPATALVIRTLFFSD